MTERIRPVVKLRERERVAVGHKVVFATRKCCGPDGAGSCLAAAEGLSCGTARLPKYEPLPAAVRARALLFRGRRRLLGLSLRDAATRLGLTPVEQGSLERGEAEPEDWELAEALLEREVECPGS